MLYGGARVQHLVQKPFELHRIQSENLPPPSLDRERHDLGLEMQLPRDVHGYGNVNMAVQRQIGADAGAPDAQDSEHGGGFDLGAFFSEHHHPERHHNSSLPYAAHDTNNVLAMRLFPVNIGVRARTEAVRIRTEDCLRRLRDADLCAKVHVPLQHPLPLARRSQYAAAHRVRVERRYDDASTSDGGDVDEERARTAHLRGAPAHPSPSALSIITRPVDQQSADVAASAAAATATFAEEVVGFPPHPYAASHRSSVRRGASAAQHQRWLPLQMLKPMGHSWSAATRSSGVRGPHMQLMQERLDQKGFGWKRKSRSLWQQDVATAGFRPHRYF
ncbi:hypothetical protein NESM_000823900 [Novymonas esmeraldas]|uniref:Helicase-associated domain-containing protein n=1 Tax=Novymonas esmeraldas TaxID=1808958 RepID=A0AAW0EWX0_9TRYP